MMGLLGRWSAYFDFLPGPRNDAGYPSCLTEEECCSRVAADRYEGLGGAADFVFLMVIAQHSFFNPMAVMLGPVDSWEGPAAREGQQRRLFQTFHRALVQQNLRLPLGANGSAGLRDCLCLLLLAADLHLIDELGREDPGDLENIGLIPTNPEHIRRLGLIREACLWHLSLNTCVKLIRRMKEVQNEPCVSILATWEYMVSSAPGVHKKHNMDADGGDADDGDAQVPDAKRFCFEGFAPEAHPDHPACVFEIAM